MFHLVGDMLGKKKKMVTKNEETEESFEDVEGLITNLGIISALILSFVVGIVLTVPMEEMNVADKTALVNFHQGFRDFVDPNTEKRFNQVHQQEDPWSIKYDNIFVHSIAALKELDAAHTQTKLELQEEKAKVVSLESENATLKTQVIDILARLSVLENN